MTKPPVDILCHLDRRRLANEVFNRYVARNDAIRSRAEREEAAWQSFGKPGRDPRALGGVITSIATHDAWLPNLQIAQLREHWDQLVGAAIARHSLVMGFSQGVLTISTTAPAWTTQLTYMIPQLTDVIRQRLDALDIREIRVTGPRAHGMRRR